MNIATEVSERFDCEFIRPRDFMISGYSFLNDYNLYFRSNIIINLESLHDYNTFTRSLLTGC